MKRHTFWLVTVATVVSTVALTVTTTRYANAQAVAPGTSSAPEESKYTLKVPGGLAFSEFRGYEDWAVVAAHHTEDLVKVVVGNPVTMEAFRAGVPGNGKPFPDGSKMAKVEWKPKKSPDAPDITVPATVYDLDFMVKDSKRFADSGGWGVCRIQAGHLVRHVCARYAHSQAAPGKRRQVWLSVPHESQGKGLRLHGVRKAVIGASLKRSTRLRGVGPSAPTAISSTSTSFPAAATLPHGNSRNCFQKKFGRDSDPCEERSRRRSDATNRAGHRR